MSCFCGIIDFSARTTDFEALTRMWRTLAPLCRGYSYVRGGVALVCERGKHMSATRPSPRSTGRRENCTVFLASPPSSALLAAELLCRYTSTGLSGVKETSYDTAFALVDEKEKLLALFAADTRIFCARSGQKIIFASTKEALCAFSKGKEDYLPICPVEISPYGTALFCDVEGE